MKWTHTPSSVGHGGSGRPSSALHKRRQVPPTQLAPATQDTFSEQPAPIAAVPAGAHATLPTGSTI